MQQLENLFYSQMQRGCLKTENFDELALTWDKEPRRMGRPAIIAEEIRKSIQGINHKSGWWPEKGKSRIKSHYKSKRLAR